MGGVQSKPRETTDAASDAASIYSNAATCASSISSLNLSTMSASPVPSDGSQAQVAPQEQITFRFCRDW
jgi:hypothetical protein